MIIYNISGKIYKFINILFIFILFFTPLFLNATNPEPSLHAIESLHYKNETIKSLRNDIRKALIVIKGRKPCEELPELKFYKYKIKKKDTFWTILAKTSLNIDTLSTINQLSSPGDLDVDSEIYITNIRGIVYKVKDEDTAESISAEFNIDPEYITYINRLTEGTIDKEYIFIPNGRISNLERSLFMGVGFQCPLAKERRTSNFGTRIDPFDKMFRFHTGIDLACPVGTKIYAARKGRVVFSGYRQGYGLLMIVRHENNYSTYYGHLSRMMKKEGSVVDRGELIALSGNTGRSTGPHLHFEVRKESKPVNPGLLLK